jgi:hypothetical protein
MKNWKKLGEAILWFGVPIAILGAILGLLILAVEWFK